MARTNTADKPDTASGSGATDNASSNTGFSAGALENQDTKVDTVGTEANKPKRVVGPKVIYLLVQSEEAKQGILGIYTNPRDVMNGLESHPGSRSMKLTLPQRDKGGAPEQATS